jgi:hypothetical protein
MKRPNPDDRLWRSCQLGDNSAEDLRKWQDRRELTNAIVGLCLGALFVGLCWLADLGWKFLEWLASVL